MRPPNTDDADVIVIGGGPAGAVTAERLATDGHRVILLDKAHFPRHKACSEYVNPAGAQLLTSLGLDAAITAAGAHRMEAMLVHAPDGGRFLADFAGAEAGRAAIGLSRFRLDHLLLQRAEAAGVQIYQGAHVRNLIQDAMGVAGVTATINGVRETIQAPLVIGADGRHSVVSRILDLDAPTRFPRRTGLVAHYRGVAGLDRWGEMHVTSGGYMGLAPLEDGLTNVALVTSYHAVRDRSGALETFFATGLNNVPAVAEKLAGAQRVGPVRGVGPLYRRVRRVSGAGYLLVGDAAGFLDPFTGDGVHQALWGGQLAADVADAALRSGDTSARALAPYQSARRQAFAAKRGVSWIVQASLHCPTLMNYLTERLAQRNDLGHTMSAVLGDFRPARQALSPVFLARLMQP